MYFYIYITEIGNGAFLSCSGLTSVVSSIQDPDDISISVFIEDLSNEYYPAFSYAIYSKAVLFVPEGTADKYRAKEGWKEFKNIVEGDPSSIILTGNEESEATETERYTLDGRRIATPQRGINVVKMSDGTVKKVLVK